MNCLWGERARPRKPKAVPRSTISLSYIVFAFLLLLLLFAAPILLSFSFLFFLPLPFPRDTTPYSARHLSFPINLTRKSSSMRVTGSNLLDYQNQNLFYSAKIPPARASSKSPAQRRPFRGLLPGLVLRVRLSLSIILY